MIYVIGNDGTPVRVDGAGDIYPVGAIYMSVNPISPASLFSGTWEQLLGKFLLPSDDVLTDGSITTEGTYHINATGGEASHTLTIDEMPSHGHDYTQYGHVGTGTSWGTKASSAQGDTNAAYGATTDAVGGSNAHNNMPPYQVVYAWKRVS